MGSYDNGSSVVLALFGAVCMAACGSSSHRGDSIPFGTVDGGGMARPDRGDAATSDDGSSAHDGGAHDASVNGSDASGGGDAGDAAAPLGPIALDSATIYSVYPQIYSQAGTLAAVTADLGRIHDLGFDVLYLLPITPIGQATGSHPAFGSPYCVHDYEAIDPAFGDEGDLVALVSTAHGLGMHVILDEVLNHSSWDNALVTQHPEFYVHSDGNPQNVDSIEQAFTYSDVAQLDYKTPNNGLAAYMSGMLTYWIRTYDVDGFRFDTADDPYGNGMIPASFWQSLAATLAAVKPGIVMFGEELDPALADAPFGLDYGWELQGLYGPGGLEQVATGSNGSLLAQAWMAQKSGYPTTMRHVTLLQDWDLGEDLQIYGGVANTLVAATFAFTIDGVPMLFAGEEVANDASGVNTHTVIDWTSSNATSFSAFYESLLALRNGNPALQQGGVSWVSNTAGGSVVTYARTDGTSTFLVALNFSASSVSGTVSAPSASGWSDVSPVGSPGGTNHAMPPQVSLAPYDFAVFRAQ